jgi:hypothetical protein
MSFSSRISHRELCSSLRESHSFISVSADNTMASSQGTSVSINSFSRWTSHDIFLSKYHFLLHILRFLFFFSDNIMADVASEQQTTALFLSTVVTRTRRHTELTKKLTNLMGRKRVLCQRTFSSVYRAVLFLLSSTAQFNLRCMGLFKIPLLSATSWRTQRCFLITGTVWNTNEHSCNRMTKNLLTKIWTTDEYCSGRRKLHRIGRKGIVFQVLYVVRSVPSDWCQLIADICRHGYV